MDRFALFEFDLHLQPVNCHGLSPPANEMHLDPACAFIEERTMFELREIEVAAELTIDSRQEIQVEGCSDAERVVVRRLDDVLRFLKIGAEEDGVAGSKDAVYLAKHRRRRGGIEVADAGAEKQHDRVWRWCN